jgi:hypothetical protein
MSNEIATSKFMMRLSLWDNSHDLIKSKIFYRTTTKSMEQKKIFHRTTTKSMEQKTFHRTTAKSMRPEIIHRTTTKSMGKETSIRRQSSLWQRINIYIYTSIRQQSSLWQQKTKLSIGQQPSPWNEKFSIRRQPSLWNRIFHRMTTKSMETRIFPSRRHPSLYFIRQHSSLWNQNIS